MLEFCLEGQMNGNGTSSLELKDKRYSTPTRNSVTASADAALNTRNQKCLKCDQIYLQLPPLR